MLHLAHGYASRHGIALHAFHIHHGISPNADSWLGHCRNECERLGVAFDARHIRLSRQAERGTEEAARLSRYAALGELCRAHHVRLLLTAHHQDDQAETVLLQLLRGSGVAGLSGMEPVNAAPGLLGDPDLRIGRPLLAVARAELADLVKAKDIAYIDDESNADTRYARNALRHEVMPSLDRYFPGFQQRLARTAGHARAARQLLEEVAEQDLSTCVDGESIDINCLKRLSNERIDNVLRYWLGSRGVRMPATSWLREMRMQLLVAKEDARVCVTHPDCHIRRHRDRIFLTARDDDHLHPAMPMSFRWNGESHIHFAALGGTLHFETAEQGFHADWLRSQELSIHFRRGGERLKPAPNRPTRSLKQHYQALNVPAWERERLPLVSAANRLLFAAGIGMDCRHFSMSAGIRVSLRWQGDRGGVPLIEGGL